MIKLIFMLFVVYGCGKPITEEKANQREQRTPVLSGVSEEILLDTKMSLNFDLLPLKGIIKKNNTLWSGDIWRLNRGAINYRWNAKEKVGFDYRSPSETEIIAYPTELSKELSPAEKYDIYIGRYDYPLKLEVDWMARAGKMEWEGLCHGWAAAALNHKEPEPMTVVNPDGVEVYFASSDIKALLTYAYAKINIRPQESIGKRCEYYSLMEDDFCDNDLNAHTFHAVLANKIGLRGQSFIADMDRYKEVWNHPIISYDSSVSSIKIHATGREVIVTTKVTYVDVMEKNFWENGQKQMRSFLTVKYQLNLDKQGNIVGSNWLTRERPDFLWTVSRPENFEGHLAMLKNLLK